MQRANSVRTLVGIVFSSRIACLNALFTRQPVPIFVINLERDVERWAATRDAFADLEQFEVRRSPGVIPAIPKTAQTYLTAGRRTVEAGTLGVFMAHVLAWETIDRLDAPALVVEDDVMPAELHRMLTLDLPADLDVLHVNHRMADPRPARGDLKVARAWTILPHKTAMQPEMAAPGGDGYLLTPPGARKLLQAVLHDGFDEHVDWRLLRYGCPRRRVARIRPGTWLETHWPMRDREDAPLWHVVRSYRSTHPLVRQRGVSQSSRQLVTALARGAAKAETGEAPMQAVTPKT